MYVEHAVMREWMVDFHETSGSAAMGMDTSTWPTRGVALGLLLKARGDMMFSTGTEFHKALSDAQNGEPLNTAAAMAENAKDLIESWTDLKVERITVKGKSGLITLGTNRGN